MINVYRGLHWLTACVALALLLAAGTGAAQAQTPGADVVGVYRSEAMDNELTGETIVWQLSLLPDGDAEVMIVFVTTDSVNFEVGTWEVADDGTIRVTLERRFDHQGGREHAIEPPYEIVFTAEDDTLTAADYLFYGPGDLVLTRTDDEPVSVLDAEGDLLDELKSGLSEFPDSLYLGKYRTPDFVIEGDDQRFALELLPGGRATLEYTPFAGQESTHSRARWRNNGDGTLTLAIEADLDAADRVVKQYDPPQDFSELDRLDSGGLVIRDILLPDGGQLIFSRAETFPAESGESGEDAVPSAAGLYAGGLAAEDVPKIGVILELGADGSLEVVATPLDGKSLPMAALGGWEQTGVTVTLTLSSEIGIEDGKPIVRATEPRVPEVLVLDEGRLVGPTITFVTLPLHSDSAGAADMADPTGDSPPRPALEPAAPSAKQDSAATEDVTYMVGREQLVAGMTVVLALNADGSASMSTQLGPDEGTLLELGSWEDDLDAVTVTLDRSAYDNVAYAEANELTFTRTDARTLTGLDYDTERYGEDLVLYDTSNY